ncbi:hypothetical protein ZWY2020_001409 [Hordeum vulgare]|nr:hypothetical protein ZWY2020_001409 [Hordeum vulgare]
MQRRRCVQIGRPTNPLPDQTAHDVDQNNRPGDADLARSIQAGAGIYTCIHVGGGVPTAVRGSLDDGCAEERAKQSRAEQVTTARRGHGITRRQRQHRSGSSGGAITALVMDGSTGNDATRKKASGRGGRGRGRPVESPGGRAAEWEVSRAPPHHATI